MCAIAPWHRRSAISRRTARQVSMVRRVLTAKIRSHSSSSASSKRRLGAIPCAFTRTSTGSSIARERRADHGSYATCRPSHHECPACEPEVYDRHFAARRHSAALRGFASSVQPLDHRRGARTYANCPSRSGCLRARPGRRCGWPCARRSPVAIACPQGRSAHRRFRRLAGPRSRFRRLMTGVTVTACTWRHCAPERWS